MRSVTVYTCIYHCCVGSSDPTPRKPIFLLKRTRTDRRGRVLRPAIGKLKMTKRTQFPLAFWERGAGVREIIVPIPAKRTQFGGRKKLFSSLRLSLCGAAFCQTLEHDTTKQLPVAQHVRIFYGRFGAKLQNKERKQVKYWEVLDLSRIRRSARTPLSCRSQYQSKSRRRLSHAPPRT